MYKIIKISEYKLCMQKNCFSGNKVIKRQVMFRRLASQTLLNDVGHICPVLYFIIFLCRPEYSGPACAYRFSE